MSKREAIDRIFLDALYTYMEEADPPLNDRQMSAARQLATSIERELRPADPRPELRTPQPTRQGRI